MAPVLDEALDALTEADRQIILLRFLEQKTMVDLGRAFRVTEDAAKMRVGIRALGRLRTQLGSLGVRPAARLCSERYSSSGRSKPRRKLWRLLWRPSGSALTAGLVGALAKLMSSAPRVET